MTVESTEKANFLVKKNKKTITYVLVWYVSENQNIDACADEMFEQDIAPESRT